MNHPQKEPSRQLPLPERRRGRQRPMPPSPPMNAPNLRPRLLGKTRWPGRRRKERAGLQTCSKQVQFDMFSFPGEKSSGSDPLHGLPGVVCRQIETTIAQLKKQLRTLKQVQLNSGAGGYGDIYLGLLGAVPTFVARWQPTMY